MTTQTTVDALIAAIAPKIVALRRDLHAHPELAFAETRTAEVVAKRLAELGIEVHRGIAQTGIVGVLRQGDSPRAIGLRADMDALPLDEANDFAHRSIYPGRMHACGHDGHTAMLLGAAELLQQTRSFNGTVYLIFQPAEEHEGGGRKMVEEGLFQRFPMQQVFGLHNWPGLPAGQFAVTEGPVMAGADRFAITINGRGGHAAMPHLTTDVVLAGVTLAQALQQVISRETDPLTAAVLSITRFQAGSADNILPETALLGGTVRTFQTEQQARLQAALQRVCSGVGAAHNVQIELAYEVGYPPTENDAAATALSRAAAQNVLQQRGTGGAPLILPPSMGAEDFAYLANACPACYVWLGAGNGRKMGSAGCMLHSAHYDFNDAIIASGLAYWWQLVQLALPVDVGSGG